MVVHEFLLLQQKLGLLNYALRTGVVSLSMIDYKNIYEYYVEQRDALKESSVKDYKMMAIENTCEKFKCGQTKVYKAIRQMTRK